MKMLIGLTGKTGSGKSSAAKIFEKLGAFVVDCDKVAHEVLEHAEVKKALVREFSESILESDGTIGRKKLGKIVFSDPDKLSSLNRIMHSAIIDEALSMCYDSQKDICILDGSEIESSGVYKKCRYVVVITADEKIRLDRIMLRDGIDRKEALTRIKAQKDYSKEAIVIENNCNVLVLEKEIEQLYSKFSGEIDETFQK